MKKVKYFFVIILIISSITSCLNNKQTVDPVVVPTTTPSTGTGSGTTSGTTTGNTTTIVCNQTAVNNTKDSVCFNTVILPFFSTNCATSGCHDSKTKAEGYDLSNYKSIISK
jgi:hypothetical protein